MAILRTMTFLKNSLLVATFASIFAAPSLAHAIEVQCESKDGSSCTVSNDGFDSVSCECAGDPGGGSTGGNEWDDFDEAQLLEVCEAELAWCEAEGTDGATTSAGGDATGDDSTGGIESASASDSVGETDGDTDDGTAGGTDSTTGAATGGKDSDSGDTSPQQGTDGTPGGDSSGGAAGSSSGGDSGGSTEEDPSGCSVNPGGGSTGALLALFALVGLRRRK